MFVCSQVSGTIRNCCFEAETQLENLLLISEFLWPTLLLPVAGSKVIFFAFLTLSSVWQTLSLVCLWQGYYVCLFKKNDNNKFVLLLFFFYSNVKSPRFTSYPIMLVTNYFFPYYISFSWYKFQSSI